VNLICFTLPVDRCNVLELLPDRRVLFQAGVGWKEGLLVRLWPLFPLIYPQRWQTLECLPTVEACFLNPP
jgi:hypothetical protein